MRRAVRLNRIMDGNGRVYEIDVANVDKVHKFDHDLNF
jgi:hypothetical protein